MQRWRLHFELLSKGAQIDQKFIHQWTSFHHFRGKKYFFFLYCSREWKKNDVNNINSSRFCLLIRENNYETATYNINEFAVAITSPLKTITGPLKKIKIAKIDLKIRVFVNYKV